jgi:predicted RNA-binding Zn-ribbon protein involved in translation (DUF1610 family)
MDDREPKRAHPTDRRLSELEQQLEQQNAQLEQLQQEVTILRAELGAARGSIDPTMRRQVRCPACGERKILHASEIFDRGDGGFVTRGGKMVISEKPGFLRYRNLGQFEVYVCTSCGLAEWYVRDPDKVPIDGRKFQILDGSELEDKTPYR